MYYKNGTLVQSVHARSINISQDTHVSKTRTNTNTTAAEKRKHFTNRQKRDRSGCWYQVCTTFFTEAQFAAQSEQTF